MRKAMNKPVTPEELQYDNYGPLYAALQRSGLVLLAALGLAVLAGVFLARRMVGPIQALQTGAALAHLQSFN